MCVVRRASGRVVCNRPRFLRVQAELDERPAYVYTLGVDDDHSYNVQGLVCENCFLMGVHVDSLDAIFQAFHTMATISKYGGGIGFHVHGVRAKGSRIKSTNGASDGLVPMLKVANEVINYVNQCFLPDTLVYTKHSGVQRMDEVSMGEGLVTRDGTFKTVHEVFVREVTDEPMLTITPKFGIGGMTCTKVHEIFALRGQDSMLDHAVILDRLDKGFAAPEFCPASNLAVGDFVCFPVPGDTETVDYAFSEEFCRLYAIMLGDGHATLRDGKYTEFGVSLNLTTKAATVEFVKGMLAARGIRYWTREQHGAYSIRWTGVVDCLCREMLYDDAHEKRMDPRFLNLPRAKTVALVRGLLETGGSVLGEITFCSTSFALYTAMRYLCLRLGVLTHGRTHRGAHVLRIPKPPALTEAAPPAKLAFFEHGGLLYTRITSIEESTYSGDVYDFNMESNHNYTTDCGLVHNSGRRKGSCAVYLEPHHADVMAVLDLKINQGDEHLRARDLFYALWISDLFMERVEADAPWSLFDPGTAPGLEDVWGDAYRELYGRYEREGRATATVQARTVWKAMLRSQIETGVPYVLFKDAANRKSNQQNLGTIKSSNLCVAPETPVLTDRGHLAARDLAAAGAPATVWNGEEWSEVLVLQTAPAAELVRVDLSDGASLECTPAHTFYVIDGDGARAERRAAALLPGDCLPDWTAPVVRLPDAPRFPHAYTHGVMCGVGLPFSLTDAQRALVPRLDLRSITDAGEVLCATLPPDMPLRFAVPSGAPLEDRVRWLEGLVDAVGAYRGADVHVASPHRQFLRAVQLMLQTMGVRANVAERTGLLAMPREALEAVGFAPVCAPSKPCPPRARPRPPVWVVRVERTGRVDATYCFNEPRRHAGVFGGVLAGNCTEIMQYTAEDEVAVCNLGSLGLPAFLRPDGVYDYAELHAATKVLARNLDRVIDVTYYPVPEAQRSNLRHRPVGIGVQGLQDVFFRMGLPFDAPAAAEVNRRIFATIYHAAVEASCDLADERGAYASFPGSPASRGQLQFDLWDVAPHPMYADWEALKRRAARGMRNSLLVAPMPTASTAQIMGNTEAFEPQTSNLYSRTTMAGTFAVVNKHLMRDLLARGLWTPALKQQLVAAEGSVQRLAIPADLKALYRTAYELSMRTVIDLAADRGPYIDQSASLNLFVTDPNSTNLPSMHFYAWRKGLKTGMYYLRSRAASSATKITVDAEACVACSG